MRAFVRRGRRVAPPLSDTASAPARAPARVAQGNRVFAARRFARRARPPWLSNLGERISCRMAGLPSTLGGGGAPHTVEGTGQGPSTQSPRPCAGLVLVKRSEGPYDALWRWGVVRGPRWVREGREIMRRSGSWWLGTLVMAAVLALFVGACGPEDTRTRDGGTGGSSRPEAPPSVTSAPELMSRPTANIPYATEAPLPTLPPLPTATTAGAGPGGPTGPATPGFGVPTSAATSSLPVTPGAASPAASPTRGASPAASPTR